SLNFPLRLYRRYLFKHRGSADDECIMMCIWPDDRRGFGGKTTNRKKIRKGDSAGDGNTAKIEGFNIIDVATAPHNFLCRQVREYQHAIIIRHGSKLPK